MSILIEHISQSSGDWHIVLINGSVDFQGHSIPPNYWIELLGHFGFNAKSRQITDEQMEEGRYNNE